MAKLAISLLGPFQATLGGQPITGFKYDKVRALLVYLAVEHERPHEREALLGLLWPDLPEEAARNNLRQTLLKLREAIGDRTAQPPFLLTSRPALQFNSQSDYWLDVTAFTELLTACARHTHPNPPSCKACAGRRRAAVALYKGDFLAEFFLPDSNQFDEWALLKREWLHRQMIDALAQLVVYHERRGQYDEALGYARQQVTLDPWREEAHRELMRLYVLRGERSAALDQFENCRRLLQQALAVEPEAETITLYEQIRDATELTPLSPAQLALPAMCKHNLPASPTGFVGREAELAEIGRLLDGDDCRLLTLTGPGGSGKTRLALQAAVEQLDRFADSVCFVALAGLNSSALLVNTIADALQVELPTSSNPKAALLVWLQDKEVLLVLDNFEHLLDGVDLLVDMLERAPNLILLVTSRERLNLQAEWVLPVLGLAVPASPANGPNQAVDYPVEENESVQLFVQSARRVYPGFTLEPENRADIIRICQAVAGLPLAIELAASWVRVLSCAEIAQEIERSSGFLTTTLRDIPARHRSLFAVFESAWRFLTDTEQSVLRRLALFRGGFRRAAAEQVAGATLPILMTLVDKSFLQRDPMGRYALHELVRQFAVEKLADAGETTLVQDQHGAFYLTLAETAEPHLVEAEQVIWLVRLAEEHDNLRAVLRSSLDRGEVETAARIASALLRFWDRHNHHPEGCAWFTEIFAHPQAGSLPAEIRLKTLFAAGSLARRQDDLPQAAVWLEACLDLGQQQGDTGWQAIVLNSLGLLAQRQGKIDRAVALYEASLELGRTMGDQRTIVNALGNLGNIAVLQGDYERAYAFHAEGLTFSREHGDLHGIAADLNNLGLVAFHRQDYAQAAALQQECLTIYRQLGDQRGVLLALEDLGRIAHQTDDLAQARAYFQEGLALSQEVDDRVSTVQFLERLAWLAVAQGKPACAAHLWGAAEHQREVLNTPLVLNDLTDHEQRVHVAREQVNDRQFDQVWAAGRIRSLEQAVRYAQVNL